MYEQASDWHISTMSMYEQAPELENVTDMTDISVKKIGQLG